MNENSVRHNNLRQGINLHQFEYPGAGYYESSILQLAKFVNLVYSLPLFISHFSMCSISVAYTIIVLGQKKKYVGFRFPDST